MYDKNDNGLVREWTGRVWLNPPYSRPLIERFVERMAEHNNGIALLYNRSTPECSRTSSFRKQPE